MLKTTRQLGAAAVLLLLTAACDDATQGSPASSSATPSAAKSAAPANSAAAAKPAATASASASAAAEAPKPGFDLFSGKPSFEGKAKPHATSGVSFDVPSGWNAEDDMGEEKLILVFSNMPGTGKGRLWFKSGEDMNKWASAAEMAKSQKAKSGKLDDGSSIPMNTMCEDAVFKATNVHPTKVVWVGDAQDATFGAGKLPGSALEAKDPDGKWQLYCVRIAITDKAGIYGAAGWRIDKKDGEAAGKAVGNLLKSFRPEGS